MKNNFIAALALAAMTIFGASAAQAASTYVETTIGGSFTSAHAADGIAYSAAIGKDFGGLRLEGEYMGSRSVNGSSIGAVNSNLGSVNLYVQPFKLGPVTPYVEGGVGYGDVESKSSGSGAVFNVGAGASLPLSQHFALDARYRLFLAEDLKFGATPSATEQYRAQVISAGLRYTF